MSHNRRLEGRFIIALDVTNEFLDAIGDLRRSLQLWSPKPGKRPFLTQIPGLVYAIGDSKSPTGTIADRVHGR